VEDRADEKDARKDSPGGWNPPGLRSQYGQQTYGPTKHCKRWRGRRSPGRTKDARGVINLSDERRRAALGRTRSAGRRTSTVASKMPPPTSRSQFVPDEPPRDEVPLTRSQAAGVLGVCKRTVSALVRKKGLPHFRMGRQYRFLRSEILRWLAAHRGAAS